MRMLEFTLLALLTLISAAGAMALRNLVHCALCAALSFVGVALLFLQLGAEFVGLAQILVYVGAIVILVVFAILLTRGDENSQEQGVRVRSWLPGLLTAAAVVGCMVAAILASPSLVRQPEATARLTTKAIGTSLMSNYVLPLEAVGLLLTAALIGAVILAMEDGKR
jgi:NADH:ubiquinone oxidoreductase subunit 6 (subunit J)